MKKFPDPSVITSTEFELLVKSWLDDCDSQYTDYKSVHLEKVPGVDGVFEIDITVRFNALGGAAYLTLCECKKHNHPIKRELVQVLHSKMTSVGAQKGILVSTAQFQSGAIAYANSHGIALVEVKSGSFAFITNSICGMPAIPDDASCFVGFSESNLHPKGDDFHVVKNGDCSFIDEYLVNGTFISDET